ncbi:hypothetical protein BaRGS_00007198 [Batillaria attramentaria]|uniref:Uncharacterized protein n=1 Tax=Batillaria attramentaria TaxID=370345 RepID=A0ABD0LQQ1_9CAEN
MSFSESYTEAVLYPGHRSQCQRQRVSAIRHNLSAASPHPPHAFPCPAQSTLPAVVRYRAFCPIISMLAITVCMHARCIAGLCRGLHVCWRSGHPA